MLLFLAAYKEEHPFTAFSCKGPLPQSLLFQKDMLLSECHQLWFGRFWPIVVLGGLLLLLLSLLIHDGLYGWAGSFCTEQNHTAKPNFMLSIYHFDDSG
ncbi:MAG: hypothetical protein ACRC4N_01420, partial [Gammaproteobacteria bacterium]